MRVAMVYEKTNDGMRSAQVMSIELDDKVWRALRMEHHIDESSLFVGEEVRFRVGNIAIEIKTSHVEGDRSRWKLVYFHGVSSR